MFTPMIQNGKLEVLLFSKYCVFTIPLTDVLEAQQITIWQMMLPHFRTVQLYIFSGSGLIEIKYKNGIFNRLLISHDHPHIFLAHLDGERHGYD